jgi:parallel beta-helix repeat protein
VVLAGNDNSVLGTNVETTVLSGTDPMDCYSLGIHLGGARNFAYRNVVQIPICPAGYPSFGIVLGDEGDVTDEEGHAWGNRVQGAGVGVLVDGDRGRAVNNTATDCGTGVAMAGYATAGWASYNTVSRCALGIVGGGEGGGRYGHNLVTNNDVGMDVSDPSAIVARNAANENSRIGIEIEREGTLVKNNTANDNGMYGIRAVPGVVDGGGNTATGNGTADCVDVLCGSP